MSANDNGVSPSTLTDAEARLLCALSQELKSLPKLLRALDIGSTKTLDRIVWRSRRVRPARIAKVRAALRREALRREVNATAMFGDRMREKVIRVTRGIVDCDGVH